MSKLEFFVALALVALAQSGKGPLRRCFQTRSDGADLICVSFSSLLDVSIEEVAALSSQNTLPEPSLNLDSLQVTVSTINPPVRKPTAAPSGRAPLPAYAADDPWTTNARYATLPPAAPYGTPGESLSTNPSSLAGTGLPKDWWKKQENIKVRIMGQQGFILNRYTVYEVSSEVCNKSQSFVVYFDIFF